MHTVGKGLSLGYVRALAEHSHSWDFYSLTMSLISQIECSLSDKFWEKLLG